MLSRFLISFLALLILSTSPANAFCGFFAAKADGDLFNESSKVVMTRKGNRTVITMATDFKGDVADFAMIIPVPVVPTRDQISVSDKTLINRLDTYSAPRVVEYFDQDPCPWRLESEKRRAGSNEGMGIGGSYDRLEGRNPVVQVEAAYAVGEYDILILSAKESDALLTWLRRENYKLPNDAESVLGSYIRQGLKFFVAKVNLGRQEQSGFTALRPLQIDFESDRFMLPIRLGTLNASGPQDLILIAITERGRVETTNYPTKKIPSNQEIPVFVRFRFPDFYRAVFDQQAETANLSAVFLEYAWGQGKCDPCVGKPPDMADLKKLGVWWTEDVGKIFVTRLHARYTAETFPEDLVLMETGDKKPFQARYVTRNGYSGPARCQAGIDYFKRLPARYDKLTETLADLTGWERADIERRMENAGESKRFALEQARAGIKDVPYPPPVSQANRPSIARPKTTTGFFGGIRVDF